MNPDLILAAELAGAAYQGLSHEAAAERLNAAVDGTRGPLDLDWLDSLFIRAGLWRTVDAAAAGSLPAPVWDGNGVQPSGSVTAEQAAAAISAARQLGELIRSPRVHRWLDTSLPEVAVGLAALTAAGVIPAPVAAVMLDAARVSRATQLGLGEITTSVISRVRRLSAGG